MTDLINSKKRNRFTVLSALYEATKGLTSHWADATPLASAKGLTGEPFEEACDYLLNEGLIKPYGAGYTYHITHKGKIAIEKVYDSIGEATQYFTPLNEMKK